MSQYETEMALKEINTLIRRLINEAEARAEARGRATERALLTQALPAFLESFKGGERKTLPADIDEGLAQRREEQARGAIVQTVRSALSHMPVPEGGIEAQDIVEYTGNSVTADQVRSVLKVMERSGEVRRIARGKYWPPRILRPGSDASTSDPAQ